MIPGSVRRTLAVPAFFLLMIGLSVWVTPLEAQQNSPPNAGPKVPEGVLYERDVEFGRGGNDRLRLDLARPEKLMRPAPCVVVIHGGAWRGGDRRSHSDLVIKFAQAGYVSATLQYRFCPANPFPAQIEDVKCGVRYLRANAQRYGIDPRRLGAIGFSAGGHLAMMLGVMGPEDGLEGEGGWPEENSQVQAVVSFFGPTDLAADDLPPVSQGLVKDFLGGTIAERAEIYRRASPVSYASKGDAPLLIFQGTRDPLVPHTQAFRMTDAMTRANVPGRVELLLNANHGWAGEQLNHTVEQSFKFFDQQLVAKPER
jgi:acetyl esterase/lipase